MARESKDEYFLKLAELVATQSTCIRRAVGAVLTNKHGHVLATGYNGVPRGRPHCNEPSNGGHPYACPGAKATTGTKLEECDATHAEQNALLQCRDVETIETCYVTVSPCIHCIKLLMNTSCTRIVTRGIYDGRPLDLWTENGRRAFVVLQPRLDL